MKKKLLVIPLIALALAGCGEKTNGETTNNQGGEDTPIVPTDDTKVTGVSLDKSEVTLLETETTQLFATISPNTASNTNVTWESSSPMIASVDDNGNIIAINEGTTTITVTTEDGSYTDTCEVTVTKRADDREVKEAKFDFNAQGYSKDFKIETPFTFGGDFSMEFFANGNTEPHVYEYNKLYAARAYSKNSIVFTSTVNSMVKIQFTFDPKKDGTNEIAVNSGTFTDNTWIGESKNVVFTIGGDKGCRAINGVTVSYVGEAEDDDPEESKNLGVKTIKEVKEYIAANPVSTGNWVNEKRMVTIKGLAVARIDTVKSSSSLNLNITEPAKVIMADETGYIGCASKTGQGNLWYKVGDYVCKETSKYSVCGYLSCIQGHPELKIISYEYTPTLELDFDATKLSTKDVDIDGFYEEAVNTNYNVAGHGYGEAITLKNVYCFQYDSDGQGKRYYWFTDGVKQMRVNAFNMPSVSKGGCYNITGIISLKNYSPIIVAWDIKAVTGADPFVFDYEPAAVTITAQNLNKLCPPQDDTTVKQPSAIKAYANFYKIVGYFTSVASYDAISDVETSGYSGLPAAIANQKIVVFTDENVYGNYEAGNEAYFILRQPHFASGKAMWEGIFLDAFLDSIKVEQ